MGPSEWLDEIDVSVTVCDSGGKTIFLNDRAAKTFASAGGYELLGNALADCHPGEAGERFARLLSSQKLNAYTIEKAGIRKLIYQVPMFRDGQYVGHVELGLPLPDNLPHFVRK